MGLLSASSTITRFIAPPPARTDRAAAAQAITRRAFRDEDPESPTGGVACGWVGVHDPLATELTPADVFFQQYLVVGFRWDRRQVPAKLLYLERRRREEEVKVERGFERLGRALRAEIKEEVQQRLMLRALPVPRLFDCAWNLETGHVLFTGKLRGAREAFQELFRQTFAVQPVPMIPYLAVEHVGLSGGLVDAVRAVEPARFVPTAESSEAPAGVPRLPLEEARP